MLKPSSLDLVKTSLQQASLQDEESSQVSKTTCYKYLMAILSKTFSETGKDGDSSWRITKTGNYISFPGDQSEDRTKLLSDIKKQSQEDLFQFISMII